MEDAKVDFDEIFQHMGSLGLYQILMFFVLSVSSFTHASLILNNFIGYTPEHWCQTRELEHLPHDTQKEVSVPYKKNVLGNTVYDSCEYFKLNYTLYDDDDFSNWDRALFNHTDTAACDGGWVYDQSTVANSFVTKWDLVCPEAWKVQFVSTISVAGFMAGSVLVGLLADRFGRRIAIAFFIILKIAPAFLSAFAPTYEWLVVANFFLAAGSIGCYVLSYTTLIEIVGPSYRPQIGLGYSMGYSVGFMAVSLFGFSIRDETKLQFLRAILHCLFLLTWWLIPESPRWLLLNNRPEEATKVIQFIAEVNGRSLPDKFDIRCLRVDSQAKSKANIIDVFRSAVLRKRIIIACLHWFTDSLIFYALSLNTASLSGDIYLNTCLTGAIEIPANLLAILLLKLKWIGRRGSAFFSLALAGVSCMSCIPLILTQSAPTAVTVLTLLGKAGSTIGFNVMYLYSAELFPTDVRDAAIGMCSFSARISGMAAPYVGGPLGDVWAPLPNLIFGSFSIVTALLSLLLPETMGFNLPDTIEMAEEQERRRRKGRRSSESDAGGRKNDGFIEELDTRL